MANSGQKGIIIKQGIRGKGSGMVSGVVIQKNGVVRVVVLKKSKSGKTK